MGSFQEVCHVGVAARPGYLPNVHAECDEGQILRKFTEPKCLPYTGNTQLTISEVRGGGIEGRLKFSAEEARIQGAKG